MAMMAPMTAAYGMPAMMPGMGAMPHGGAFGQPVYFSSMSQLPPGAVPLSQGMLAQALGMPGAQVMPERSSVISRVLKGAGLGAAAGAAFGAIPFLPLGLFSGALVGAGMGAALALLRRPKPAEGEFHTMTPGEAAQAQMAAATPAGARSVTAPATTSTAVEPKKVVMGPEMRKKWAAKVRAEQAAAAKAAAARS